MFLMSAFTGLAFTDVSQLTEDHIVTDNDGNKWIRKPRQKTEVEDSFVSSAFTISVELQSIFSGGVPGLLLKETYEMLGMLKAQ